MAGLSHTVLRRIILGFGGAGLLSTEMLRARSLPTENPRISPYLVRTAQESPLSYQLLAFTDKEIAPAIEALHRQGADVIDLNMGCAKRTVTNLGGGFALMEEPGNARRLVSEARRRTNLPLTAKIRLGVKPDEAALMDFVVMLEGEGIDMLTVHGRFKRDIFARAPHWEWIGKVKERLAIPVIANGGIFAVSDGRDCLAASGADGLMLGRGAVIRPWLFAETARELYHCETAAPQISLPRIYESFMDLLTESFRPERRLGRLKEFTHYFAGNYKFGHLLTAAVQSSASMEEAKERAAVFFQNN